MGKHPAGDGFDHCDAFGPAMWSREQWGRVVRELCLSKRQAAVVGLILQGKKDKDIAAALGLSKSTVRTHLERIFARLDVADRMALVVHMFGAFGRPVGCRVRGFGACPYKSRR
jgi:ATP/maltotriose-dependent transcriptional regulator MalT